MAVYESKYSSLVVYNGAVPLHFTNGRYVTEDEKEIAVLDKVTDCERVDKPVKAESPAKPAPKGKTK